MQVHTHNDAFDLYKSLLAMLVVVIHTVMLTKIRAFGFVVVPLVRLAVPLFFLFSGYFVFGKLNRTPKAKQSLIVKGVVLRYCQLYLFWFVVNLPVIYKTRPYFTDGLGSGIVTIVSSVLFGSTFAASWYISALAIDILLLYFGSKVLSNRLMLFFSLGVNLVCVLFTNYGMTSVGQALRQTIHYLPFSFSPALAFPVGLLWLTLGKMLSENKSKESSISKSLSLLLISFVGLYYEQFWIMAHNTMYTNDCFFMLIPVCYLLFTVMLQTHFTVPNAPYLRAFSTIAYCFHASFAVAFRSILAKLSIEITRFSQSLMVFAVTIIACMIVTIVILKLDKYHFFQFLKYSH